MEYFGRANKAKEKNQKAEYEETIKLIANGLRPEKVIGNLSTDEFMNRYQTELEKETKKRWKTRRCGNNKKKSRNDMGNDKRRMGL